MSKTVKWIIAVAAVLLLAAAVVLGFGIVMPWYQAESADSYCVELLIPAASGEEAAKATYRDVVQGTSTNLLALGDGEAKVTELYGENYVEDGTAYVCTRNDSQLFIIVENGSVVSIEYRMVVA